MKQRTEWDPHEWSSSPELVRLISSTAQFSWWYVLWITVVLFLLFFTCMPEDLWWLLIWNDCNFGHWNHVDSLTLETTQPSYPTWQWTPSVIDDFPAKLPGQSLPSLLVTGGKTPSNRHGLLCAFEGQDGDGCSEIPVGIEIHKGHLWLEMNIPSGKRANITMERSTNFNNW